jgi:hypothetical protein
MVVTSRMASQVGRGGAEDLGWAQQGLNLRLRPCEERTLPLSYAPNWAPPWRSSQRPGLPDSEAG